MTSEARIYLYILHHFPWCSKMALEFLTTSLVVNATVKLLSRDSGNTPSPFIRSDGKPDGGVRKYYDRV